jgi:hypothetical protein
MSPKRQFFCAFAIALTAQLVVYWVFRSFGYYGIEKPGYTGSPTPFGNVYLTLYLVPPIARVANRLGVGGGLATVGLLEMFTPLVIAAVYSAAFALLVQALRRSRQKL